MRYRRSFLVRAPLERVVRFHRQAGSLAAITPPPLTLQLQRSPAVLDSGAEMEFTTGLGPLRIPWLARIQDVTPSGFSDAQLRGPFRQWIHRHSFVALSPDATLVTDEVRAVLQTDFPSLLVGLAMWLSLPPLFRYRARQTRRLLEEGAD